MPQGKLKYQVDNRVIWNPRIVKDDSTLRELHGHGPFRVVLALAVPNDLSATVGHPQWLAIEQPSSEIIMSQAEPDELAFFSGIWFSPAD